MWTCMSSMMCPFLYIAVIYVSQSCPVFKLYFALNVPVDLSAVWTLLCLSLCFNAFAFLLQIAYFFPLTQDRQLSEVLLKPWFTFNLSAWPIILHLSVYSLSLHFHGLKSSCLLQFSCLLRTIKSKADLQSSSSSAFHIWWQ